MTIDECDPSTADRTAPTPGSGLAGALAQGRLVGGLARARPGSHRLRPFRQRIEYRLDRRCAREMVDLLGAGRAARCQCAAKFVIGFLIASFIVTWAVGSASYG